MVAREVDKLTPRRMRKIGAGEHTKQGSPTRYKFPRPMIDRPGCDFSFSGLKTFALNTVHSWKESNPLDQQTIADVALAFQNAVVDTLTIKCKRALEQTGYKRLVIAGGVGANQALRSSLSKMAQHPVLMQA